MRDLALERAVGGAHMLFAVDYHRTRDHLRCRCCGAAPSRGIGGCMWQSVGTVDLGQPRHVRPVYSTVIQTCGSEYCRAQVDRLAVEEWAAKLSSAMAWEIMAHAVDADAIVKRCLSRLTA